MHVTEVLNVSLEENLIHDFRFRGLLPKRLGREVFYDAEHFLRRPAAQPGVRACEHCAPPRTPVPSVVILCDTNGGTLPEEVAAGMNEARRGLYG